MSRGSSALSLEHRHSAQLHEKVGDGELRERFIPSLFGSPQPLDVMVEAARLLGDAEPGLVLVGPSYARREFVGSHPTRTPRDLVQERVTIRIDVRRGVHIQERTLAIAGSLHTAKRAQGRGVLASPCTRREEGAIGVAATRLCSACWRRLPVARRCAKTRLYAPTTEKRAVTRREIYWWRVRDS